MISLSMVIHFLGGIGLFLCGVNTTSAGLQKIAANKLKSILGSLTKNTWVATLFGVVMTVALQSSAATNVLVVEFVNSGLMTLVQALGVSLGSTVGSSLVIQLISFPILDLALLLTFIGFILLLIVRTQLTRQIGQTLIGFGCIFVGMAYLSGAFAPLRDTPEVYSFLSHFGSKPILGILVAACFTALIQSSTATVAILISLSSQGLLSIEAIIPLVMGAQIGGTITVLISSLAAERVDAKRVAIANSLYRITAALLLIPFLPYFADLVVWSAEELPRQVANTHLFSALFMVLLFLPLNGLLADVLVKLIPGGKSREEELKSKYITKGALEIPTVALSQAHQELRWLGSNILENMLQLLPRFFSSGDPKWLEELTKAQKRIDWHYNVLAGFLTDLFHRNMTRQQIIENHGLQLVAKELKDIAESLAMMARLGQNIHKEQIQIADHDWILFEDLYYAISDNYLALLRYLEKWDKTLAARVIKAHEGIIEVYNQLQGNLVCQIQISGTADSLSKPDEEKSWKESLSQGQKTILELGNWFYKIGEHIVSIAKVFQR